MLKIERDIRKITFTSRDDMAAISETLKFIDDEAENSGHPRVRPPRSE